MKRLFGLSSIAILLIASAALARPAQGSAVVVGSWDLTVDTPQGARTMVLIIKQEGDKLTGMLKSPRGERPLDSVSVKGSDITFVMTAQVQGQDMVMKYTGKVEKDSMKGDADFGGLATGTWSAVPHKADAAAPAGAAPTTSSAMAADITGVWAFEVELSGGQTGAPTFTFKQEGDKLTGTYKGALGEGPVTGMIKGDEVKFSYKISAQGQEVEGTYTGKVTGKDSMAGTVSFSISDLGTGKWTAKKK